ncbi:hypothetical protein GCM10022281_22940 [Sphingomonas rosea]|uniref:DUF3857 domain-containing protein n=1 Tax=Sphingomonas rosea TaxID=335605 RepID=A0ABP7UE64_9SPHN
MRYLWGASAAIIGCVSAAHAAEPVPAYKPAPAWVEPVTVPAPNPKLKSLPAQMLVVNAQQKLERDSSVAYLEYVAVPQTVAGLRSVGTMVLPWDTERSDLTIHKLELRRGGKVIDAYDAKALMVLNQENNLDKAMLSGVKTVVLPVKGVQVGDQIVLAASYTSRKSPLPFRTEYIVPNIIDEAINRAERRVLVTDGVPMRWYRSPGVGAPATKKLDGMTEYRFVTNGSKEREWPTGTPKRFKNPVIQASAWSSWTEVADSIAAEYAKARVIKAGTPLAAEADKIAAASKDPEKRLLAALRLSQDEIRYVALLLGQGAYVPAAAEETWERRFGDCKGKTVMLLGLLDRLGIEAHPMLVSSAMDGQVGELLPSMGVFDHVIVRAKLNGKMLYLDPTDYGQRTVSELERTTFDRGLPLVPGASLVAIEKTLPASPLREAELVWDGRQGFERKVPFTATLILRDEGASAMRATKASSDNEEKFATGLKNLLPGVGNDDLIIKSEEPEQPDGTYRVTFTGSAAMDWSPIKGMKGYRYELSQSTVKWDIDPGRTEAADHDLPMFYNWPYFERTREVILLPNNGKGFRTEGTQIDRHFGGVHVSRSVKIEGDKAVVVSSFTHEKPEVDADAARSVKTAAGEISEQFAYVIAPGKIRPVADEGKDKKD